MFSVNHTDLCPSNPSRLKCNFPGEKKEKKKEPSNYSDEMTSSLATAAAATTTDVSAIGLFSPSLNPKLNFRSFSMCTTCRIGGIVLPASLTLATKSSERSYMILMTCAAQFQNIKWNPGRHVCKVGCKSATSSISSLLRKPHSWKIAFALDPGGISDPGGQESLGTDSPSIVRTRLGRIISSGGRQFLEKLNLARKNFPMKIFLLLLGFYTANALATILGQTGDWDVLVAGIVVAAIEGIGMLIYKKSPTLPTRRLQSFMGMVNYWKAGVCLGLFVDAFKLGS